MAAMQDSSVLFSLNQLMNAHETRLREEQETAARRAEAEKKAREEAARLEAEAVAARLRAEAEKKAREEAARREEEARLEAIRVAAIEKARLDAETQARMEMMRKAEEHERALAALRADAQKKRLRRAVIYSTIGSVALFGAAAGIYFGKIQPDTEARLAEQSGRIAAISEDRDNLRNRLEQTGKRIREAEQALAAAQAKRDAEAAANRPSETDVSASVRPGVPHTVGSAKPPVDPKPPQSECLPGDPSCDINGRRVF